MNKLVDIQTATEIRLSKEGIRSRLENDISHDRELQEAMLNTSMAVTRWAEEHEVDVDSTIVHEATLIVLKLVSRREVIGAIAGQIAHMIEGYDTRDAIEIACRLLVVMCDSDLFDLEEESYDDEDPETGAYISHEVVYISNPWELSKTTEQVIEDAMYLPPMLVRPQRLTHNKQPFTLTGENKSLILGKRNHHNGDICLDSLNIASSVALSLNVDMLKGIKESLLVPLKLQMKLKEDPKRKEQYDRFMRDSAKVYSYLINNGNRFYLGYKPDKRGRKYSQGYHANVQGDTFRKCIVDLHNKEVVEGF